MIIKAIVFDAYGTLFDLSAVNATLARVLPEQASDISQLWRQKQLEYTWLRALMGRYLDFKRVTRDALDYVLASLGLELNEAERKRLLTAYSQLDLYPEVMDCLEALSSWQRVILSNGSPEMLRSIVTSAGLTSQFDAILSVDAVKTFKPDPRVYRLATEHFSLDAVDVAFVSSNGWDVAGAKAFGFFTCWVNRSGNVDEILGVVPDLKVRNLRELVSALVT
jgi:2-haloacid dehalogenase